MSRDVRTLEHVKRRRLQARCAVALIRSRQGTARVHRSFQRMNAQAAETAERVADLGLLLEVQRMWDNA